MKCGLRSIENKMCWGIPICGMEDSARTTKKLSLIGEQSRYSFRRLEIEFGCEIMNRVEGERDEYRNF